MVKIEKRVLPKLFHEINPKILSQNQDTDNANQEVNIGEQALEVGGVENANEGVKNLTHLHNRGVLQCTGGKKGVD